MNVFSFGFRGRILAVVVLGVLAFGVGGCRHGAGHNDALVRLINAAPDAEDLSVAVNGRRVWSHSSYRSSTGYGGLGEGTYQVEISAQQGGQRLTERSSLQCRKGQAYTLVAFSRAAMVYQAPSVLVFSDPQELSVPAGKIRLRLINSASGAGAVDLLFNNIVGLQGVAVGSRSEAILLDAGAYDVKLYAAGGAGTLTAPVRVGFQPGRSYTLVAMGAAQNLSLVAYPDSP